MATRQLEMSSQSKDRPAEPSINVSDGERALSVLAGGVLGLAGLMRLRVSGVVLAGLGAALAYRGLTGHCATYEALNMNTADADDQRDDPSAESKAGTA